MHGTKLAKAMERQRSRRALFAARREVASIKRGLERIKNVDDFKWFDIQATLHAMEMHLYGEMAFA
jgi:hypothetical protein